jgi:hypothetical protein
METDPGQLFGEVRTGQLGMSRSLLRHVSFEVDRSEMTKNCFG